MTGLLHALAVICEVTGATSLALFAIVVPVALIARWRYQRKERDAGLHLPAMWHDEP